MKRRIHTVIFLLLVRLIAVGTLLFVRLLYPSVLPRRKGYKMKVTYDFANGEHKEVEVNKEIAAVIAELERKESSDDRKQRYHCYSLDACDYEGKDFAYEDEGIEQIFAEPSKEEVLIMALQYLTECQRSAIIAVCFKGLTQEEYAKKVGIKQAAVSQHLRAAKKKLKKFL